MRIIIFANGQLADPSAEAERWIRAGDTVVAADGGARHAQAAGVTPQHVIGDQDSLSAAQRERLEATGTRFHSHPSAKDETDLELALLWAAGQPSSRPVQIILLGALGGRPDQMLANLLLLALPELAGCDVRIVDGPWQIRLIRGGETATLHGAPDDLLSLIPLGGEAEGVVTEGLAYPLREETLRYGPARGVSNRFEAESARVTLASGQLWCFHRHGPEQR
ncbi:MAG: thiamine diphosphokinase [Anaerolineales bacterium]